MDGVINQQNYNFLIHINAENVDALKTLRINRSRPLNLGCSSVIILRPKIGVEPPKHDVISMPTQQYTNTNYISLERSRLVVSFMLRYMDRFKTFDDNLSCREVKIDKKFGGDLPYFALKCDKFL